MSPTRIVLPPKHKPFADELLLVTGIDSLSNLFVILLTRYGNHLKASWNVQITVEPSSIQPMATVPTAPVTAKIYNFPEPQTQTQPEVDPFITRIAGLVDLF